MSHGISHKHKGSGHGKHAVSHEDGHSPKHHAQHETPFVHHHKHGGHVSSHVPHHEHIAKHYHGK